MLDFIFAVLKWGFIALFVYYFIWRRKHKEEYQGFDGNFLMLPDYLAHIVSLLELFVKKFTNIILNLFARNARKSDKKNNNNSNKQRNLSYSMVKSYCSNPQSWESAENLISQFTPISTFHLEHLRYKGTDCEVNSEDAYFPMPKTQFVSFKPSKEYENKDFQIHFFDEALVLVDRKFCGIIDYNDPSVKIQIYYKSPELSDYVIKLPTIEECLKYEVYYYFVEHEEITYADMDLRHYKSDGTLDRRYSAQNEHRGDTRSRIVREDKFILVDKSTIIIDIKISQSRTLSFSTKSKIFAEEFAKKLSATKCFNANSKSLIQDSVNHSIYVPFLKDEDKEALKKKNVNYPGIIWEISYKRRKELEYN